MSVSNPDEEEAIFRKDTENSKATVLVAEENKLLMGFISLSFPYWDRIVMTHHLVISPELRGNDYVAATAQVQRAERDRYKSRIILQRCPARIACSRAVARPVAGSLVSKVGW